MSSLQKCCRIARSPSGKAPDFGSGIRRFESSTGCSNPVKFSMIRYQAPASGKILHTFKRLCVKSNLLNFTSYDLALDLIENSSLHELLPRPDLSLEDRTKFTAMKFLRGVWARNEVSYRLRRDSKKFKVYSWMLENYSMGGLELATEQTSYDGTRKFLWTLQDGNSIESVLIPGSGKTSQNTLCISSQVGCTMGCTFCLTATQGLIRNLEPYEIVEQVYAVSRNHDVHKIVFMGMGEPLHNLSNLLKSIEILTDQSGFSISSKKITVSTSGLVPAMEELMAKTKVKLAVSLNASTNSQRSKIMPVNKKWSIHELIKALKRVVKLRPKSERILIEYVLIAGINDHLDDAKRLVSLVEGLPIKINLIPINSHDSTSFNSPNVEQQEKFKRRLLSNGIAVTLRRSRGLDISAACGQLKSKVIGGKLSRKYDWNNL